MKLKITVDGKVYEVDVDVSEPEDPQPDYIPPTGHDRAAAASTVAPAPSSSDEQSVDDENKVCRSPISGVVVRVAAQVGQTIQVNDELVVLEAMKMETVITAPIAGTISRINADVGDSVQAKQVLIEFE